MALPPILSNLPIFKLFKPQAGANAQKAANDGPAPAKVSKQDSVEISRAAGRAAELTGKSTLKNDGQARDAAANARNLLEQNNVALGLDPKFAG